MIIFELFSVIVDCRQSGVGESPCFLLATCGGDNLVKLWHVYTASGKTF